MRPTTFKVDNAVYWTIRTYTDAGVLVDADSTPSVAVRKNGAGVGDSVTVIKRTATTGIYDCTWNPSGEVEGDCFTIEETATVSSQAYENSWSLEAQAAERGTDSANTVAPDNQSISDILNTLPDNFESLDINISGQVASQNTPENTYLYFTSMNRQDQFKANVSGLATQASVDSIDGDIQNIGSDVSAVLTDTNELQQNQGDWATATGFSTFDASTDTVTTDTASRDASKADVSGLSTFDHTSDQVVASNMRGTDNAILASSAPSNWSDLIVGTGADLGKVTTSNPASGGGSNHTAQDVANLILVTPANKLATDGSGNVEANNMRGTDGANTVAPDNASIADILTDTNELQSNQADWATATGFATPADVTTAQGVITTAISGLNDFDPVNDVVAHVTLVDTTTDLTNQNGGGGGGASASDIYDYFVDGNREDVFKADTSGLSTFDPASDVVARVTLVDTTTDLTNQTSGGVGMFQASVLITDNLGNALQGARVNVDGTTLSLTTGVSGTVQFNLDSGVYLLNVLPPANYDTPSGQVLTITSSDPSQTVFTLTSTSPPDGCDVPWLG